ncbi:MAG: hypothetical protein EU532_01270 [Promethearchaeota archaeon]|nr:MAG: hypothetical protein EU532_01270 [Candidatus Lokiarchaeota archaeon]
MIFLNFPISGDLRLPLLIMEWIYIITGFEISLIFLIRYFKQEKNLRNLQDLGYFSLFFGFSLMWFFFIIGDYYVSETIVSPFYIWKKGSKRALYLNFGYLTMIIAAFFLLVFIEKYDIFLFKRYLFTFIFSICAFLFVIVFLIDITLTQPITYIFWIGFLSFFIIYIIKFIKKIKTKGILLFSGLAFMLIGFLLTTDALIEVLGLEGRMIGAMLQLISVVILSYFFLKLPPFNEFDWQEKIEAVFLVNSAGICLYYKIFEKKKQIMDEHLISAAIASINIMLQALTEAGEKDKGISVIKKKGENVIIYSSKLVSGVLYTSEELNFPKLVLKEFVEKFETLYYNILKDWNGDTNIFNPTEIIANEIFSA